MPFSAELEAVFRLFIKPALEEVGFSVTRADDLLNQRNIMQDIVSGISNAEVVVADLTGANPNVFYELGIAHTLEKPTILLTQAVEELPFDLRSYRVLAYQTHFAKIECAKADLARLAQAAYEGTALFGNPVTDFRAKKMPSSEALVVSAETPPAGSEDDRGFIDHFLDVSEGYGQLAGLIGRSTQALEVLTPKAEELSSGIARARETGGQLAMSQIRFLCQKYSASMEAYTTEVQQVNNLYEEIAERTQNSLEFVVRFQRGAGADPDKLRSYIGSLKSTRASAIRARDAYISAREAMVGMLDFERNMRRSGMAAMAELDRLISNFSKTISSIDRAIEAAGGALAG